MRAVLDTNVIVSALLNPNSSPGQVLEHWSSKAYVLIVSDLLLDEFLDVLSRPRIQALHKRDDSQIATLLKQFWDRGKLVNIDETLQVVIADPSDDVFVQTALAGNADFIVSGDRHLLELGEYRGIQIVTPAEFLAILAAGR